MQYAATNIHICHTECTASGNLEFSPAFFDIIAYIASPTPKVINISNLVLLLRWSGVLHTYNNPTINANTAKPMHNMSPILNPTSPIENTVGFFS